MANGESEALAKIACARTSTTTPKPGLPGASTDEGTSTGVVAAVGIGGLAIGAAAMAALRRRPAGAGATGAGATGAAGAGMPPAGSFATPAPSAPMGMPAPGMAVGMAAPGTADRSPALVTALVELSDRVSSQALRAEIFAALERAGVRALEPATGDVFDANRMRGVGSSPAPDPTWAGRVANTERVGFLDGGTLLRLPEVVVYTNGG
ncbi:MAG: hypothetical protein Q7V88_07445 [Actinomycetota bacterium]|nr:hypothetical protein [Actinomycetota bacterium]